jgi:hypothetical protein
MRSVSLIPALVAVVVIVGCDNSEKVVKLTPVEFFNEIGPPMSGPGGRKPDAEKKYEGALIEMTAQVWLVGMVKMDQSFKPAITVRADRGPVPFENAWDFLILVMKDPHPWKRVGPGGTVTVRGRAKLWPVKAGGGGILLDCEIVSAIGDPVPSTTAHELAKEFKADPQAIKAKFDGENKYVTVTGVVASIGGERNKDVFLDTGNDVTLVTYGSDFHETMKVGDRIEVICKLSFVHSTANITLTDAARLDSK